MKVYKDGMTLMKDTCSITNALMENKSREIKEGDTFAILMWSDRSLWKVTKVVSQTEFYAERVETYMKDWADGTEYPKRDESGNIVTSGQPVKYKKSRKYWYEWWANAQGVYYKTECKVHFAWGETTGYRDPSF